MSSTKQLSQDAHHIASGLFLNGANKETAFHMEKSKPSDRCQAALDELYAEGFLIAELFGKRGIKYIPTDKMRGIKFNQQTKDTGLAITEPL